MPKIAERMTEKKLRTITKDTACGVVPGLYIRVRPLADGTIGKYFVLIDRATKRVFPLGRYPKLTLSDAFKKAADWKALIKQGIDPAEEEKKKQDSLKKTPESEKITVKELVYQWIRFNEARGKWQNERKPREWVWDGFCRNHLSADLLNSPAESITAERLAEELSEKWQAMIDTPERILSDMKNAFDWGMRNDLIPVMLNPAQIKGGKLEDLLPLQRPESSHEAALPVKQMPDFFRALIDVVPNSQTARALAFAILTSARNTTAREATWSEIVKEDGQWIHLIPRERMKMKKQTIPFDRKTPLSAAAYGLLRTAPRFMDSDLIFPNINRGKLSPHSLDAFRACIKRMHERKLKEDGVGWVDPDQKTRLGTPKIVTQHGLSRATFNTWAKDASRYGHPEFSRDLRESCLDHRNESYQCAYDREQALGDMRIVYDEWAKFCCSKLTPEQREWLGID